MRKILRQLLAHAACAAANAARNAARHQLRRHRKRQNTIRNCAFGCAALLLLAAAAIQHNAQAQTTYTGQCAVENIYSDRVQVTTEQLVSLRARASVQIANCNASGWGVMEPQFGRCYCNIKVRNVSSGFTGPNDCTPPNGISPEDNCQLGGFDDNRIDSTCQHYFGLNLEHLPQKTDENQNSCFAARCVNGQEPSLFNMHGETECRAPVNCGEQNREQLSGTYVCGECLSGFVENAQDECVRSDDCVGQGRKDGDAPGQCGGCLDTHVLTDAGTCAMRLDCPADNRIQVNAHTCGACVGGFTESDIGECRENINCAAENRTQATPYRCGDCASGYTEVGMACQPTVDCQSRGQQPLHGVNNCGDCLPGYVNYPGGGAFCRLYCERDRNRVEVNLVTCGECLPGFLAAGEDCQAATRIQYSSTGAGTLSVKPEVASGDSVLRGTTLTFTAEPAGGYDISSWSGDCPSNSGGECELTATAATLTVGVVFADINECASGGSHDCGANSVCGNTAGGFECACAAGFYAPNNDGKNCGASQAVCGARGPPEFFDGTRCEPFLSCDSTATLDRDVNECVCPAGHASGAPTGQCADINECSPVNQCGNANSLCANTVGGFNCVCAAGFHAPNADGKNCAASAAICGGLSPAQFFNGTNCEALAVCAAGSNKIRDPATNTCVCRSGEVEVGGVCEAALDCSAIAGAGPNPANDACVCDNAGWRIFNFGGGQRRCAAPAACAGGKRPSAANVCECPAGMVESADGTGCLSQCPAGQESDGGSPPQCEACPADEQNPTAGGACRACDAGSAPNAARTACADIDECATGADNCADDADGGVCKNQADGTFFACSCKGGYSGDGRNCEIDKTVSLRASANGTVSAGWGGDSEIVSGETVPHGATVTFTATPAAGHYVSGWTGDCAGDDSAGDARKTGAGGRAECALQATVNLEVGAVFSRAWAARAEAAAGGEIVIHSGGNALRSGESAAAGALVTFTARPDVGRYVLAWSGDCAGQSAGAPAERGSPAGDQECALRAESDLRAGAVFERSWLVAFSPNREGGRTEARVKNGAALQPGDAVRHGTTVVFTARPAAGFYVRAWSGSGACGDAYGPSPQDRIAPTRSCEAVVNAGSFQTAPLMAVFTAHNFNACLKDNGGCAANSACADSRPLHSDGVITCGACDAGRSWHGAVCGLDLLDLSASKFAADCAAAGGEVIEGRNTGATDRKFHLCENFGADGDGRCWTTNHPLFDASAAVEDSDGGALSLSGIENCNDAAPSCGSGGDYDDNRFTPCVGPESAVRLSAGAGGTLHAVSAGGVSVHVSDGVAATTAAFPGRVTFTAVPAAGYYVSLWAGDCASAARGSPADSGAARVRDCAATAASPGALVSAAAVFADVDECGTLAGGNTHDCGVASRASCVNLPGSFRCECRTGYYAPGGDGRGCAADAGVCAGRSPAEFFDGTRCVARTVCAAPLELNLASNECECRSPNEGTVSDCAVPSALVCGGLSPAKFYDLASRACVNFMDCADGSGRVLRRADNICACPDGLPHFNNGRCEATDCGGVSGLRARPSGEGCECAVSGFLVFGDAPNQECKSPVICPPGYSGDDCVSGSGSLRARAGSRQACLRAFGGDARDPDVICSGIDINDTFCILGLGPGLSCLGLFEHVRDCNRWNRPALDPFHCAGSCGDAESGDRLARGARCETVER